MVSPSAPTVLSPPVSSTLEPLSLDETLANYRQAVETLNATHQTILTVLLARDQAETALIQTRPVLPETVLTLSALDKQLQQKLAVLPLDALTTWREVTHPPESAWWWFLEQQASELRKRRDTLWELATGTMLVLAAPLALEIIQRFWEGAPDAIAIWGTLLTLLVTTSPLVKQGREVVQRLLEYMPFIKLKHRAEIMTATAGLSLAVLLCMRLWFLPGPLTTYYNNAGVAAQALGNLSLAQRMFQHAAALNPDRVVPYQNLAEAYRDTGLEDKAIEEYEKAIEYDANFAPAYRGLGELYNQKSEYATAEMILLAGLNGSMSGSDETTQKVTHYELLANLGWSYWGQKKLEMAQAALEDALNLEAELKTLGEAHGAEYRLALPHFYLAQIYEGAGNITQARQQWEDCLRFLDQADWRQRERYMIAQQHLLALEDK